MELRRWQSEAIDSVMTKFQWGDPHFLCLATPGAGKTLMASLVAQRLMNTGQIDLVFCFSPSVNVSTSFQSSLQTHLRGRMDGRLGSKGQSLTYQSMLNLDEKFWSLMSQYRTLVIFDEIHHCAGGDLGCANAWGEKIMQHIQGQATYTLALTGTPWRSDKVPIVLSSYCHEGRVQCDYSYGLGQAITDQVCRIPRITAIDNEDIRLKSGSEEDRYRSFGDLLSKSKCSYQQLLENTDLITYLLRKTANKLNQVRKHHPEAGGLIVAASVEHALKVAYILEHEIGDEAYIATYMHDNAQEIIRHFRDTREKWIISVGMISEGTDIPRLRVCCHLTRVKTELYFRQVLGRILRSSGVLSEEGYLLMPAEHNLIEYAQRIAEDIPQVNTITVESMETQVTTGSAPDESTSTSTVKDELALSLQLPCSQDTDLSFDHEGNPPPTLSGLPDAYDATIGLFGRFRQQIINLTQSEASI